MYSEAIENIVDYLKGSNYLDPLNLETICKRATSGDLIAVSILANALQTKHGDLLPYFTLLSTIRPNSQSAATFPSIALPTNRATLSELIGHRLQATLNDFGSILNFLFHLLEDNMFININCSSSPALGKHLLVDFSADAVNLIIGTTMLLEPLIHASLSQITFEYIQHTPLRIITLSPLLQRLQSLQHITGAPLPWCGINTEYFRHMHLSLRHAELCIDTLHQALTAHNLWQLGHVDQDSPVVQQLLKQLRLFVHGSHVLKLLITMLFSSLHRGSSPDHTHKIWAILCVCSLQDWTWRPDVESIQAMVTAVADKDWKLLSRLFADAMQAAASIEECVLLARLLLTAMTMLSAVEQASEGYLDYIGQCLQLAGVSPFDALLGHLLLLELKNEVCSLEDSQSLVSQFRSEVCGKHSLQPPSARVYRNTLASSTAFKSIVILLDANDAKQLCTLIS